MLRICLMQQCYALPDPAMEDAHGEVESMRCFAGMDLIHDALSGETAILKCRHLLEKHALTGHMMDIINDTHEHCSQLPPQLRRDDRAVFGNKGDVSNMITRQARKAGVYWSVSLIASRRHPLNEANKRFDHRTRTVPAQVEHVFCLVKRWFACKEAH
jgi:IS5 family transposase